MNVASLELCKELYELSSWETGAWHTKPHETYIESRVVNICPAYGLGYLREKLVDNTNPKEMFGTNLKAAVKYTENVKRALLKGENDTAKLCIELFKQGVLKEDV